MRSMQAQEIQSTLPAHQTSYSKLTMLPQCDGVNPCNRCTADNSICMYGERKKAQDKIYPKGYAQEILVGGDGDTS